MLQQQKLVQNPNSVGVLPQLGNRMNYPCQMPPRQPSQNSASSQFTVDYVNRDVLKNSFGIITDQNASIPLILDSGDTSIKFTNRNDSVDSSNKKNALLDWDSLDFQNTEYYTKIVDKNSTRIKSDLQHSSTATNLYLIDPNPKNRDNIHHPNLDTQKLIDNCTRLKVEYKRPETKMQDDGDEVVSPYLSDMKDLSGINGTLYLLEQTSEFPPFILNVGMASRFVKYYHQSSQDDFPRQIDSLTHIIKPEQESPFIAPIPKSKFICSITCDLFDVPVARHDVNQTDFLLIRGLERNPKTNCTVPSSTFYIRRINEYFCAGLLEAKKRVLRPNKKTTQEFISNYIKAILINVFRGTEQNPRKRRIQVSGVLKEFFPDQNEPKLRDAIKGFARNYRDRVTGYWEPKEDVDLTQLFQKIGIQPEEVCSYQSMQSGFKRLRKSGVNILIRSKKVYQQINNLSGDLTKRIAYKIEMELMKTPWARTENFTRAFEGQLMEISRADNGEEIMRSKGRRGKNEGEQKKQVRHGTEADLRSLTIPELNKKLKQYGVLDEKIGSLTRWQKVKLLREIANENAQQGISNDDTKRYARGPRSEFQAKVEQYKKLYESSFENNLVFISSSANDDEAKDFNDDSLFDELNIEMAREDSDSDDDDDDISDQNYDTQSVQPTSVKDSKDPPMLKPYGLATHKFDVDWSKIGFDGYPMRKAAKIIDVRLEQNKPVVTISWRRSPHQIAQLEKLENYVNSELTKMKKDGDLETDILFKRKKELRDKLNRTKASKKKNIKEVSRYINAQHLLFLITDSRSKKLSFDLRTEFINKIRVASEEYNKFMEMAAFRKKKKSSSIQQNSSSDSDADNNTSENYSMKKNERRYNPLVTFNDIIKTMINELINNNMYFFFTLPSTGASTPQLLRGLKTNLVTIRDKANDQKYARIQDLFNNMMEIRDYCKSIDEPNFLNVCDKMINNFKELFQKNEEQLRQLQDSIDPSLVDIL